MRRSLVSGRFQAGFSKMARLSNSAQCARCERRPLSESKSSVFSVSTDPARDPRHVVSAAFLVHKIGRGSAPRGADDATDAKWFLLDSPPSLAADYEKIIADAIQTLKDSKSSGASIQG